MSNDTIAAVSTPFGTGGIGIIRISGKDAFLICERIYKGQKPFSKIMSHTINYGHIIDPDTNEKIDEVMITKMVSPKTYTREDTAEINCHGGIVQIQEILDVVLKTGARTAQPGEFTKKSFFKW